MASEPREITLTIKFKVGTLEQIGLRGLKQPWIDAEAGDQTFDLMCGAGLGNPLLEASVHDKDGRALYAQADIQPLATDIFNVLRSALEETPDDRPRESGMNTVERVARDLIGIPDNL